MNDLLNALMSMQLPFALLPTLIFTSSRSVMGDFQNGILSKIVISLLGVLVIGINLYFVDTFARDNLPDHWAVYFGLALYILFYVCFVLYLAMCLMYVLGLSQVAHVPVIGRYVIEPYDLHLTSLDSPGPEMYKSTDNNEISSINMHYRHDVQ
ncbi:protein Malvolio-like [Stegodyphus dumicola]|uniref:protein Malvolio-like n=1 Tax=Stegodyphus dumicola TaxID=202533 RepID=UPI0015B1CC3C|nr:protein Malvolio-like [Stegodyphus dumicola]